MSLNDKALTRRDGYFALENSPQEQVLLDELRASWGIAVDAPLTVIGQLRMQRRNDDMTVFFLEKLEHPQTGVGLAYLGNAENGSARAFVPLVEIAKLADPHAQWAIVELQLSPESEREKNRNAYACTVRRGSLRLLREIPEQWNVSVTGAESVRRISAAAFAAIQDRSKNELARLGEEFSQTEARNKAEASRLNEEIVQVEAVMSEKEIELEGVRNVIRSERLYLSELNTQIVRDKKLMNERLRYFADLLAEKGRRLVALDLIDKDDLEALLPKSEIADVRPGHDFKEVLNGDFARLAPFVQARLWKRGMLFSKAQLRDFFALLRTHDLIVLAGDSGSGKTSLIRSVAESIGGRCSVIPVKPNWTGPEDLLGYYNPIERSYQPTPFLLALQAAQKEPSVLHFICLDEMNLARVEYYFADFLSLLEQRNGSPVIPLYTSDEERHAVVENSLFLAIESEARSRSGLPESASLEDLLMNDQANGWLHQLGGFKDAESVLLHHARLRRSLSALVRTPTSLLFPPNVRIIGAINVDETTHYLSPKVLDRVHVLRFRNPVLMNWEEVESEVESFDFDMDLPLRLSAQDLGSREDYPPFDRLDGDIAFLARLARRQLDPLGVEFGLRAIRQAANYILQAEIAGIERKAALNNVILHKLLPKLMLDTGRMSGDGRPRREILIALRNDLDEQMAELDRSTVAESCVEALDHLIAAAESNNGIANYWLR